MAHTQTATRLVPKTVAKQKAKTSRKPKPDTNLEEALEKMLSGEDEVVVYKNGRKVGAIISAKAFKFLIKKVEEEEDRLDIEAAEKALAEEGEIAWEDIKKKHGL